MSQTFGCAELLEKDLLGNGGENAKTSSELLDGSSGFEPAVPFLLLGLEELITEVLPLLGGECRQDPDTSQKKGAKLITQHLMAD